MKYVLPALLCSVLAGSVFAAEAEKAEWFLVNYTGYKHKIDITINGKNHMSTDRGGSGLNSKPSPLKEGKNRILVRFHQRPGKIGKPGLASFVRIFLSPKMMAGDDPLPAVEITDVEDYCESDIEVMIEGKVPQSFKYVSREWVSNKKNVLLYEEELEREASSEIW